MSRIYGKRVDNNELMKAAEVRQQLDEKTALLLHQQAATENARAQGLSIELLHNEFPPYPSGARKEGIEGVVELKFPISKAGRVQDIQVLTSPDPRLSKACIKALKKWRFRPIVKDGVVVTMYGVQQFPFKLY